MLQTQRHLLLLHSPNCFLPVPPYPASLILNFPFTYRPNNYSRSRCHTRGRAVLAAAAAAAEEPTTAEPLPLDDGPIELFSSNPPIFSTSEEPTPLQTATSVLLTGAITVFLFRSLRRRAKLAKEKKISSSGGNKSLSDQAVESLKSVSLSPITSQSSATPVQAFLGAVGAAVIALILYKFTTTIESSLNRQTISDNYSVRQITITIRTIINGLCYLATFVFGVNSLGLFLYSGQLAFKSLMEDLSSDSEARSSVKSDVMSSSGTPSDGEDQSSENTKQ